jgi:hypothetical protein
MYRLQLRACNKSYVDQTGRSIEIRPREHIKYIKTNHPISAYTLHILENRHEYGNPEQPMHLLQPCSRGKKMDYWESFYMQVL